MPQSKGLRAVRHTSGYIRTSEVKGGIASGYNTDIFLGDPLKIAADGTYVRSDGAVVDGIFMGVHLVDSRNEYRVEKSWVAGTVTTDVKLLVATETSGLECEISTDAAAPSNIVGKACNLTMTAGSHLNGSSAVVLNVASAATPGTAVRVKGFSKKVGNVPGDVAILVVEIL
ncbi:hypothetical protein [Aureimonas sp. AU40]|uniref:hypothetical protein n=1 Tax=Aureimonas sp. AU40 TaxID=1637747 RepID=UPI000784A396|nr:hypothetical protein [Aureimonas sp. AU40]